MSNQNEQKQEASPAEETTPLDPKADAARLRTIGLSNQAWMPRSFGK
jgi:hypothetical protein